MKKFAAKEKRSALAIRRFQPSRFGYRGPEVKAQQADIRSILRSSGVQPKLTMGQPNDQYEREADRIADQVMAIPDPKLQRQPENEEEEEETQTTPAEVSLQRQPEGEEEELRTKSKTGETPTVIPNLESRIHAMKSSGQPLREST
jgi:hypothetical protein